ncbi:MAG: YihY/virulence factor BrkB family protein [Povalibacter sp.]
MSTVANHSNQVNDEGRGRHAERPADIPKRGWWDITMRVKRSLDQDNVSLVASGLALYALLAVFPALAAAVSIYGLFASPQEISQHLQTLGGMLPEDAMRILNQQLSQLSSRGQETLSVGVVIGILIALWSARKGMTALMAATNIAYNEQEERGFFKQIVVSSTFTIGAVVGFLVVLSLTVAIPIVLHALPLGQLAEILILALRWALLWLVAVAGLAVVYRYAPDREKARWHWITPGSAIAASLWLAGGLLFAVYVRNWGSYGETYGALGGVIVLLMWFYLSGYIIILGAEINSELERQTVKDTTEGSEKPIGQRGAFSADTIGPASDGQRENPGKPPRPANR